MFAPGCQRLHPDFQRLVHLIEPYLHDRRIYEAENGENSFEILILNEFTLLRLGVAHLFPNRLETEVMISLEKRHAIGKPGSTATPRKHAGVVLDDSGPVDEDLPCIKLDGSSGRCRRIRDFQGGDEWVPLWVSREIEKYGANGRGRGSDSDAGVDRGHWYRERIPPRWFLDGVVGAR